MTQLGNRISYFVKQPQVLTFFVALLTVAISLAVHEPWLDEADAPYRIHSHGWHLGSLMRSFRGDGHFPVYHVLLFSIFNVGQAIGLDAFFLVKLFTFIQYSLLAYLTCKWIRFPFSLLFLFSYYTLYEYGTISRVYLLSLLCLLIILKALTANTTTNKFLVGGACFVFPLTHPLSLVYAGPLWFYVLLKRKWLEVVTLATSASVAFYYLNLKLSQSNPLSQFIYLSNEGSSITEYSWHLVRSVSAAWFPFSNQSLWWNKSITSEAAGFGLVLVVLVAIVAVLSLANLYAFDRGLFVACFAGGVAAVVLLTVKYPHDFFRHTGYGVWPFLLLLALVLSFREGESSVYSSSGTRRSRIKQLSAYSGITILTIHSFFGIAAVYKDYHQTFSASVEKFQVLTELVAQSADAPQIFAHPCWSFVPIRVLSNWRYASSPLWNPDGKGCSGTLDMIHSLSHAKYPDRIILSTWRRTGYSDDFPIFTQPELNQQFGKSLEEFLKERFSSCKVIKEFGNTQDVTEYLYECRQ